MATHSSILAWRIPWTEEPGRLQSRGSERHNGVTKHTAQASCLTSLSLLEATTAIRGSHDQMKE